MRSRGLLAGLALVLALLAYAPALDPARQLAGRDLFHLFYPLGKVVADATRAGSILPPPRDPTRGLGVALAPDPLAWSFYPPRLLHAVLPYDLGFKLALVLHAALAGYAASRLARTLGASARSSVLAVAGAIFAGPVLSLHRHPNLLAGAAWAPLAVAWLIEGADGGDDRARRRAVALAALAIGLTLLAGGIEVVLGLAPLLLVVAPLTAKGARVRVRAALLVVLALGLGGLLASIQLAPTYLWLPTTMRPGEVEPQEAFLWSLPPLRLVSLALPFELGHERGFGNQPFSQSVYLGVFVVALAGVGVARGGRRARALAAGTALVLLLALGKSGVLLEVLRDLPIYGRFRFPEKLVILPAVLVPALAARGLSVIRGRPMIPATLAVLLLCGATLDIALANRRLLDTVPVSWLHEPPATVALLGRGRFIAGRGVAEAVPPASGPETKDEAFLRTVSHHREVLLGGLGGLYGLEDASAYGPFAPSALADLLRATQFDRYFLHVTSVSGVFVAGQGRPTVECRNVDKEGPQELSLTPAPGTGLSIAKLGSGPRAVFVPGHRVPEPGEASRFVCEPAVVLERDQRHAVATVDASGEGWLVLSDLFLPGGTEAWVDDAPSWATAADCALVAVPIDTAGKHTVRIEWSTPGLAVGAAGTGGGLLAIVFVLAVPALVRRVRAGRRRR